LPPLPQLLAGVEETLLDLAVLTSHGEDEDDAVAVLGRLGQGATRGDGLVVRVGVEADECPHCPSQPSAWVTAPASTSLATSSEERPQSRRAASVCSPGAGGGPAMSAPVRLNLGAGAGWTTPSRSTNVCR